MMRLRVHEDRSEVGGYAFVDLGQKVLQTSLRIMFHRTDGDRRSLGLDGWQAEGAWITPLLIDNDGETTVVRIGPNVVDRIDEYVPIEIVLEGRGVLGEILWPSLTRSPGATDVRILKNENRGTSSKSSKSGKSVKSGKNEKNGDTGFVLPPFVTEAPSPPDESHAPTTPEDSKESADSKEPEDSKNKKKSKLRLLGLFLIALIVFGATYFAKHVLSNQQITENSSPEPAPVPPTIAAPQPAPRTADLVIEGPSVLSFKGLRGGPYTPDRQTISLRASGNIAWVVTSAPRWLATDPSRGELNENARIEIAFKTSGTANDLAPQVYEGEVTIKSRDGDRPEITRPVRLEIVDPTPVCDQLMATQYDTDLAANAPFTAYVESLTSSQIESAITHCQAAVRTSDSRRLMSQTARALAARAVLRARAGDEVKARADMRAATDLWTRSSELGSGAAKNFLGALHKGTFNLNINFVNPDLQRALQFWIKGAELNNVKAMTNAGAMLLAGSETYTGIQRNPALGKELLTKAADKGDMSAASVLGQAYFYGTAIEKNIALGVDLLARACRAGDDTAKAFFDRETNNPRYRDQLLARRPSGC